MGQPKGRRWGRWLVGGCGVLVLLPVAVVLFLALPAQLGYRRAAEAEGALIQALDGPATYRPAPDGRIPPERLEVYLAIRRELAPRFPDLKAIHEDFRRMDRLKGQAPDASALADNAGRTLARIPSVAKGFGGYVDARNALLAQHRMGLGEYTWICWCVHVGLLGHKPSPVIPAPEGRPHLFVNRLPAQLQAMAAPLGIQLNPEGAFPKPLPAPLQASLAPRQKELEALACAEALELDLTLTVRRGLRMDHQ